MAGRLSLAGWFGLTIGEIVADAVRGVKKLQTGTRHFGQTFRSGPWCAASKCFTSSNSAGVMVRRICLPPLLKGMERAAKQNETGAHSKRRSNPAPIRQCVRLHRLARLPAARPTALSYCFSRKNRFPLGGELVARLLLTVPR